MERVELPGGGRSVFWECSGEGRGGRLGGLWRAVAAKSGPYKKISVRCDSILPGLMDAWVLPGLMTGCFGLLGLAVWDGVLKETDDFDVLRFTRSTLWRGGRITNIYIYIYIYIYI